jgi:hypothetical protein
MRHLASNEGNVGATPTVTTNYMENENEKFAHLVGWILVVLLLGVAAYSTYEYLNEKERTPPTRVEITSI